MTSMLLLIAMMLMKVEVVTVKGMSLRYMAELDHNLGGYRVAP